MYVYFICFLLWHTIVLNIIVYIYIYYIYALLFFFSLLQEGESHHRRGYWGDIVSSPYLSYGIQCEDKSFFKTANKVFIKASSLNISI